MQCDEGFTDAGEQVCHLKRHQSYHISTNTNKVCVCMLCFMYMLYSICKCVRGEREGGREGGREERGAYSVCYPSQTLYGHMYMYLKVHGRWWLANAQHVAGGG